MKPTRGTNRYRNYSDEDVASLRILKEQLDAGGSIGELSKLGSEALLGRARASAPRVSFVDNTFSRLLRKLLSTLNPFNRVIFNERLNGAVAVVPFEETLNQLPVAEICAKVVVACSPGEGRDIAALTVAYRCRVRGCRVYYYWVANMPLASLANLCGKVESDLTVMSFGLALSDDKAMELVQVLADEVSLASNLVVGGHGAFAMRDLFVKSNVRSWKTVPTWMSCWIDSCGSPYPEDSKERLGR